MSKSLIHLSFFSPYYKEEILFIWRSSMSKLYAMQHAPPGYRKAACKCQFDDQLARRVGSHGTDHGQQ